ncbi:hypothetical protein HIM_04850 [Hirsutella minnesotensis 3608]|uniref:Heme haloperoxidase family profile domain-containing protein n=1 Tax=Hirsutella minnesotensis 3608 TaxID=1043627 RepID=A0A0F7ZUY9_9HYPO|nr:hypothetical protein HIM_04850 [Hirsutella minnesotensis 3608]
MKYQALPVLLSVLSLVTPGLASAEVRKRASIVFDANDPRRHEYQPPGPNDSRSPCPGLNVLANHGFLPRNGRKVNIIDLIIGAFTGLGVDPGTSAIVGAIGYASSHNIFSLGFDLEDLRNHLFLIEHDCSFSRNDARIGNNNDFDPKLWEVALNELKKAKGGKVRPTDIGRAKGERVQDAKRLNPRSAYGPRAVAFGGIEVGLVMSALGPTGVIPLNWIRSFFEEERMPTHLGWKPTPLGVNPATVLIIGTLSLTGDKHLLAHAGRFLLDAPADIIGSFLPKLTDASKKKNERRDLRKREVSDFLSTVRYLVEEAGFNSTSVDSLDELMANWTPPEFR